MGSDEAYHPPRRGAWSVCVHRREAATVSYTEVQLAAGEIRLLYVDGSPCTSTSSAELTLDLSAGSV